jgi:vitamin K-dependent gamma-carboxylase-like protein
VRLFAPVDIASLVCFRIAFGALMAWEVTRYFSRGWIRSYFVWPAFHFKYYGFGWVEPWPGPGMELHFAALGALALCLMFGLFYRLAAALFFLGFGYVFLLDQTYYLNHFYLIVLLSLILVFVPAHRALSLDAWRRPGLRAATAPAWALWLLRLQVGIPYFYAGLAKLNGDWLRAEPMRMWLAERAALPVMGPLLATEWAPYLFAYGGLVFDLAVVPALLWRPTRPFAFATALVFHGLNALLFRIGVFPWLMIAATTLFFPPDWPRRFGLPLARPEPAPPPAPVGLYPRQRAALAVLGGYLAVQLLFPLRHFLYPGNVHWTEEGHRFSWHMKLRDKDADAVFDVRDVDRGATSEVSPRQHLSRRQAQEMASRPDMILQFAHHLAAEARRRGHASVEVRARVTASLNGRPPQPLVDSEVDLAGEPRTLLPARWIVPLREPLPGRRRVD